MSVPTNPVRRLPRPTAVHAHIGRLLRELRIARRLLRLSKAVVQHVESLPTHPGTEGQPCR